MKFLIIFLATGGQYVIGFSSLADCGAVQQSITVQYAKYPNRKLWTTILVDGGGQPIYYVGCL